MGNKTALVLGASGLVGNELVKTLIQQNNYEKIHLLVRRPIEFNDPSCEEHIVDFDQLHKYQELFQVTDVFCCIGTTIKKAKSKEAFRKVDYKYPVEAAKISSKSGVEKFLIITAMGSNSKSLIFYNQVKGQVEEALRKLIIPSVHIFKPSLLLGERTEFRFGERIAEKASAILNLLMIGPLRPYKAIEARNVAAAMAAVAQTDKSGVNIYPSHEIERIAREKK
ncbi:NAD-dependent epimerase/dehydratase family protein [Bacillus sp. ISL-40]|uniref:NAD-dependent epimerase/dehydratase family protein n=1 Tax=unclassified Bacillus (in: firmicutes) TaxID=185979 RepID=UPI001BEB68AA|nr:MULTISPECIES: NAD-dependent epimerase/dehydratase family protein [unclassified Bacillus (in: firmicutes)]MBT2696480.1 NAD-dependent epimerase/dehydratase family protein [Bacillus sp. ISL-40]MBT2723155.1 NAD-dependent epimerase/dehydratase family protein [Bacillus sp. ISL-46]MBT2741504.1 NAD-dependent epimerase/dehydratase family protein [Bacillus sp. ISL-77]